MPCPTAVVDHVPGEPSDEIIHGYAVSAPPNCSGGA